MKKNGTFSKILSLALVMAIMLTTVVSAFSITASAEVDAVVTNRLLTNFEDGALFTGDQISSNDRFTIASDVALGSYSLKAIGSDAGTIANFTMNNFNTEVGKTYMITGSYYVENKGVDNYTWFSVWELGKGEIKSVGGADTGAWKTFSMEYTCTIENAPIRINVAKSTIYFDDIYVYEKGAYDKLPAVTDFKDAATATVLPILPVGSTNEICYEYNAGLGKNVLVGTVNNSTSGWSKSFYIPYKLKAGVTYTYTIRYYSEVWMTSSINSMQSNFANVNTGSWQAANVEITAETDGQQIALYTPNNNAVGKFYVDYIVLKEKAENTNTATKQVYDFDNIDFASNTITASVPKLTILGDTFVYDFSVAASGKKESNGKLDYALTTGNVYKLSYDYKGQGDVRFIPNNGGWGQSMYSVEQSFDNTGNNLSISSDTWATHTATFIAKADSTYLWAVNFKVNSELYIDNIVIEDVTSQYSVDKYVNDFEDTEEQDLAIASPLYTDVTYEADAEYGTVAKIHYKGTGGEGIRRVRVPLLPLAAGETYRIKVIYKSNGWVANGFDNSNLVGAHGYGAVGVEMTDWAEQYFYYTPEKLCTFGLGTNQADVTIWVAEIQIEKVTGVVGDLDNNGEVNSADLVLMRKWLFGSIGGNDLFDCAFDINEDGEKNIIDLVRLRRRILGLGDPITVIVDECANDVELYSSTSNIYKNDNNALFNDVTRYRVHTLGSESNIIYFAKLGLIEAAIGFDRAEACTADMKVYVSENQSEWTEVTAKTVTTKPDNDGSWTAGTKYYDNLSGKYLKIVLPDSLSFAINKVYINGLDSNALSLAGAQNPELRDAATIYVSNDGSDENDGFTPETAKATLAAATAMALVPGDIIALNCGDTFDGGAMLSASGTAEAPIKVTSYGEGDKPVITNFAGSNHAKGTGLFVTGEYIEISNLAFTDKEGYSALSFYAYEAGATKGLKVENCYFYDINHTTKAVHDNTGGIHFVARGGTPTWFDGVTVENNEFESVARTAIYFSSEWIAIDKAQGWSNRNLAIGEGDPYLAENILVKGNTINNNGGDAIMLIGTKDAVIEYNVVSNSHLMMDLGGERSFAAIWCHSSIGCVMQYNEVYKTTGENNGNDLNAFDIDHACTDCVVQYNYTHDNDGASVIVCGTDNENNSTVSNSIIRYNISVNDGLGENRSSIDLSAGIDGVIIHNNTIVAKDTDRLFTIADYCSDGVYVAPQNIEFYNNLFYGANSDTAAITYGGDPNIAEDITVSFKNNMFRSIDNLPWDEDYARLWATPVYADNLTSTDKLLKGVDAFINNTTITNGIESVYNIFAPVSESVLLTGGYDMSTVYSGFEAVDYAGNGYTGNIIGALNNGDLAMYHNILTTGQTGALECTYSVATNLNALIIGTAGSYALSTTDGKHITWEQENMQTFWIDGFITEADKANINNYYILQASSDNATWSDLTYDVAYSAGGNHQKCRLTVSSLPVGTKYVKLTKANGYNAWNKGSIVGAGYTYSK